MKAPDFEQVAKNIPFRPFTINVDKRVVEASYPDQVFIAPDRSTVIVALPHLGIQIIEMDLISSIHVRRRPLKRPAKP